MDLGQLFAIIIGAIFVSNFVLMRFLGLCPFVGVSKDSDSALGMGMAVIFVMTMASLVTWFVYTYVLVPLEYLHAGAPPPSWFIDDLMKAMERPYYVGLLSAAGIHGASHQQRLSCSVHPAPVAYGQFNDHVRAVAAGQVHPVSGAEFGDIQIENVCVPRFCPVGS